MTLLTTREMHRFDAAGHAFVYLVPSAAVFELDDISRNVLDALTDRLLTPEQLVGTLSNRHAISDLVTTLTELRNIHAIGEASDLEHTPQLDLPVEDFPLTTMVLNVTSKCNLACTYCYEYGEDRIADAEATKPPFIDEATARQSVDFLVASSGTNRRVHLTFFGGETLLNFKVLQSTVAYARGKAESAGKAIDFSLTTNATLLKPKVIDWLVENDVGVTISIDGPKTAQDDVRVFKNGTGSYDIVLPRIRELLRRHRTRPVGARVTLTKRNLNVLGIFRHLTEDLGFWEVGFAPVTTSSQRDFAIDDPGYDTMLAQFEELGNEFRDRAVANRHHGFSNVRDTLEEIHKGVSKAYPCGAGLGLLGVATDGEVGLCHRFAGSEQHAIGSIIEGIDRERQREFLTAHHISNKTDCATCWARPLCAGGCYHEAYTRYGDTATPNLHYCDWIRRWTDTCLRIYGEVAVQNPGYLKQFDHAA